MKSSENIQIVKSESQPKNNASQAQKKPFVEPGNPCEVFEEVISSTSVAENGITTYFVAKALKGPLLNYASQ